MIHNYGALLASYGLSRPGSALPSKYRNGQATPPAGFMMPGYCTPNGGAGMSSDVARPNSSFHAAGLSTGAAGRYVVADDEYFAMSMSNVRAGSSRFAACCVSPGRQATASLLVANLELSARLDFRPICPDDMYSATADSVSGGGGRPHAFRPGQKVTSRPIDDEDDCSSDYDAFDEDNTAARVRGEDALIAAALHLPSNATAGVVGRDASGATKTSGAAAHVTRERLLLSIQGRQNLFRGRGLGSATYWVPYAPRHYEYWPECLHILAPSGYWETDAAPVATFGALVDNLRPAWYLQWTAGVHFAVPFVIGLLAAAQPNSCSGSLIGIAIVLFGYAAFCAILHPFRWGVDNAVAPLMTVMAAVFTVVVRSSPHEESGIVSLLVTALCAFLAFHCMLSIPLSLLETLCWRGVARQSYSLDCARAPKLPPPPLSCPPTPGGGGDVERPVASTAALDAHADERRIDRLAHARRLRRAVVSIAAFVVGVSARAKATPPRGDDGGTLSRLFSGVGRCLADGRCDDCCADAATSPVPAMPPDHPASRYLDIPDAIREDGAVLHVPEAVATVAVAAESKNGGKCFIAAGAGSPTITPGGQVAHGKGLTAFLNTSDMSYSRLGRFNAMQASHSPRQSSVMVDDATSNAYGTDLPLAQHWRAVALPDPPMAGVTPPSGAVTLAALPSRRAISHMPQPPGYALECVYPTVTVTPARSPSGGRDGLGSIVVEASGSPRARAIVEEDPEAFGFFDPDEDLAALAESAEEPRQVSADSTKTSDGAGSRAQAVPITGDGDGHVAVDVALLDTPPAASVATGIDGAADGMIMDLLGFAPTLAVSNSPPTSPSRAGQNNGACFVMPPHSPNASTNELASGTRSAVSSSAHTGSTATRSESVLRGARRPTVAGGFGGAGTHYNHRAPASTAGTLSITGTISASTAATSGNAAAVVQRSGETPSAQAVGAAFLPLASYSPRPMMPHPHPAASGTTSSGTTTHRNGSSMAAPASSQSNSASVQLNGPRRSGRSNSPSRRVLLPSSSSCAAAGSGGVADAANGNGATEPEAAAPIPASRRFTMAMPDIARAPALQISNDAAVVAPRTFELPQFASLI
jgi:hypothetical protein